MKYIFSVIIFSALSLGAIFVGCGVTDSPKPKPADPDPFPSTVGSWWVYERIDSLTMVTDTLTITVSDTAPLLLPEDAKLWTISSSMLGKLNSMLVSVSGDTILVTQGNGIFRSEQFVLPFDSGYFWQGNAGEQRDSSEVTLVDSVSTPAGLFPNTATIRRAWSSGFEGNRGVTLTCIVPAVGIVSRHEIYHLNDGSGLRIVINDNMILLDYRIN